ncbi:MAG: LuxR C-terminal-related transcriptional regulator [Burkholderiales bacterium]
MRVLLAAGPGLLGDALANVVQKLAPRSNVVRADGTPDSVAAEASGGRFDLALLDVDLCPDRAGEWVSRLVAVLKNTPLVTVAPSNDEHLIAEVFDSGAFGYLPKSYSESLMIDVLRLVLDGAVYRPATQARADEESPPDARRQSPQPDRTSASPGEAFGLTERQCEVLALAAQGKTNQAIARQLGIAEGTVKLHMNAIFRALNVTNRSEAILFAGRMPNIQQRQIEQAEGGKLDLDWLLPHMTHRRLKKGTVIFRKGEPGRELYYLQRGTILLKEIGTRMEPGSLFGEIGIFAPAHERTCSAECETDTDLFALTADQVKQIYYRNPQFAFFVVNLIAKRLMSDRERMI